jgi:hypothetical protein
VLDIVQAQREGHTPEGIRTLFAVPLTLAQVYSALAYADENRDELDALYAAHEALGEQIERDRAEYLRGRPAK